MVSWMKWHQLCVGKPGNCEPARTQTQSLLVTLHFPHWQVWLLLTATNSSPARKRKTRREHNIHNAGTPDYPSFQQDNNCLFIITTKKQSHPASPDALTEGCDGCCFACNIEFTFRHVLLFVRLNCADHLCKTDKPSKIQWPCFIFSPGSLHEVHCTVSLVLSPYKVIFPTKINVCVFLLS